MFQVSELRKHQLVEAHVRVYCCRHARQVSGKTTHDDGYVNGKCAGKGGESDCDSNSNSSSSEGDDSDGDNFNDSGVSPTLKAKQKERRKQVDTAYYQTHNVRLQHPDDELGALLLMSLPNIVVHRLDEWSPMMPPPLWWDENGRRHVWRGCLPPNVDAMGRIIGFDDDEQFGAENEEEDEARLMNAINGRKVAPGFPELLQRACDKEVSQ